jgi:hypothetical protein
MDAAEFYAASNLRNNPFRPSAVGVDDPRAAIWVGYERQRVVLERLLTRVRADQVGLTSFVLLYGHWGTGKSHALLWARSWVKNSKAGLAYYLSTLKRDKGKLALSSALSEDVVERGQLPSDLKKFHSWLQVKVLTVQTASGNTPDEALQTLFPIPESCELATRIYHTEGNLERLKELLLRGMTSEHEAVTLFSRVVNLFVAEIGETKERFVPAVYLLIDELDDLGRQPAKDSLQTNDTLRHLYDACPNCFGFIVAASAELNTLQHLFTEYVLSRMTRKVEFEFLDQDAAKTFIRQVLDQDRVDPQDSERSGYFPLDEGSVGLIVSHLREITPRDVVNTMQQILEEIRLAGIESEDFPVTVDTLEGRGVIDFIFE